MTQNQKDLEKKQMIWFYYSMIQIIIISIIALMGSGKHKEEQKKESIPSSTIQLESNWIPSFFESMKLIGKDSITYKVLDNETKILEKSENTKFKQIDKNVQLDNNTEKELSFYLSENKDWKYFTINTKKATPAIAHSVALISDFSPNSDTKKELTRTVTVNYADNKILSIAYVFSDTSSKESLMKPNELEDIKETLIDGLVDNKFQATFATVIDRSLNLFSNNTGFEKGQYYKGDIIVTYYKDNGKNLSIVIDSKPDEQTAEGLKNKKEE